MVEPPFDRPSEPRSRPVPWGWLDLLMMAVVGVAIFFTAVAILSVVRPAVLALEGALAQHGLSNRVFALVLSEAVLYLAVALAIWLVIGTRYHISWSTLGFRVVALSRYAIVLAVYPVTVITAGVVMALVTRFVLHGTFTNPQAQEIAGGVTRTAPNAVTLFVVVAVIAPIAEETLFRGVLYQLLRKSLPIWLSAIASAAIFALAHGIPVIMPWLFVTGIALALVFEYCGSLFCSMLLHGLINGVNIVVLINSLPHH